MKQLLPQPYLSVCLLFTWLLANAFDFNHLLLGTVLAIVIPWFSQQFWPQRVRFHRPLKLVTLVGRLLVDIVVANIAVARVILGPVEAVSPRFIRYPLQLQDSFAITLFANSISLTPGTVSADLSEDNRTLLIHALDVDDEPALVASIHARYETLLREIFEPC